MKKFSKSIVLRMLIALFTIASITGCQGGSDNGTKEGTATNAPKVETETYTVTDEKEGITMTFEVPKIDGIEVKDLGYRVGYRIAYEEGGWRLDVEPDLINADSMRAKMSDEEKVTYGDNNCYVEYGSWAAHGRFDFGASKESNINVAVEFDLRPEDTYQPDDEDELRGYMEDENVGIIFASLNAETVE